MHVSRRAIDMKVTRIERDRKSISQTKTSALER